MTRPDATEGGPGSTRSQEVVVPDSSAALDVVEVRAAGGLVWRPGPDGDVQVAIVHRPRYGDWTLPKGKLDPGETDERAAEREVEEETGMRCALEEELGTVRYRDRKGRTKQVRYWAMKPIDASSSTFSASHEVDEVRWVTRKEAGEVLTYDHDQTLVKRLER